MSLILFRTKMYKTRIKKWGLDKKNKENEMRAIVRKHTHRSQHGLKSIFRIRGRTVNYADVLRYWERKKVRITEALARRAISETPEAVECLTPEPLLVRAPKAIMDSEHIFVLLRDYYKGPFESGTWRHVGQMSRCYSTKDKFDGMTYLKAMSRQCGAACNYLNDGNFIKARRFLDSATANVKEIILSEDPFLFTTLFLALARVHEDGWLRVALVILRHFSDMGKLLLGNKHPLHLICKWLVSQDEVHQISFGDVVQRSLQVIDESFEMTLGSLHIATLSSRLCSLRVRFKDGDEPAGLVLQKLLLDSDRALGRSHSHTLRVCLVLAHRYLHHHNFQQAKEVAQEIVARINSIETENRTWSPDFRPMALNALAIAQDGLGETQAAVTSLWEARKLFYSPGNSKGGHLVGIMLNLEQILVKHGELDSAVHVKEQRMSIKEAIGDD